MTKKYIVFTSSFDDRNGGIIALHKLCDSLNAAGEKAYLWNKYKPLFSFRSPFASLLAYLKYLRKSFRHPFQTFPDFTTPLATKEDLKNAIIIYPEITNGNPLNGNHVVRWFLHKPGYHSGKVQYEKNELYFFYQHAFNDPHINPHKDHLLRTVFMRNDIYQQTNFGKRSGTCYILRKGKGRPIVHDLTDSTLVDDFNHVEMAAIFNQVEMCISYDPYTMYSRYAALCGAISVIIPENGLTKEAWKSDEQQRYGLAYGFDDIPYACQTQPLLLANLQEREIQADQSVKNFIARCNDFFS